ncbi:CRISPR-associated ring nuclease Csm6 [Thermodesulfovibrio yellowstonii]|uniref:CRISPR-associated ring nuclease Csm6 n=1 Tax=Thermodesulfovibrio yellowstonii TaxID=28262 RepID=UPI0024B3751C|nr:CRISPR-associated ring nuclease Csm6 [Thermodesulfovibrio yellowstonii]MDI6864273.1 CRISPR-associated ring nuclease Csm6 [Thermodesulfovibrio yellowstonii]
MYQKFEELLVCVAGATPQIITETIYALAIKDHPVYINKLFVITTKRGKEIIIDTLLNKGILISLISEYNLPVIEFSENSIITLKTGEKEIDDIRDTNESEAAADIITNFIAELAKDATTRLHCSIAGGRKTMSFYLGTALQLFGRPHDRLYHVLVSPEFEANREFFYPPKKPRCIKCRLEDGSFKMISTAEAKIELAELPFLRLRDKIELKEATFKELMKMSQNEIDIAIIQPEIKVKLKEREIKIVSDILLLPPVMLTIYSFFLKRKIECDNAKACLSCNDCYLSLNKLTEEPFIDELASLYGFIYDKDPVKSSEFKENYTQKYATENLRSYISKINRKISQIVSDDSSYHYCLIKSIRKYGSTLYGVPIDKRKIKIV